MKRYFLLFLALAGVAYGATTFTTNYNFNKPGDGDRNYGELVRDNWDKVDTQLKINEDSVTNHLADTVDAHDASAISATVGANLCTVQTNVQDYLTCLDGVLDPSVSGVVLLTGAQTISGVKTFSTTPIFSAALNGVLQTDGSGAITATSIDTLLPLTTKGDLLTFDTAAARLGVGSDGQTLVADSGEATGVKWDNPNPRWRKFTLTFSDFSAAATSFGVTAFSLSLKEGIDAVAIHHTTGFSGGSITNYTVEVGTSADTDRFGNKHNVFQGTGSDVSSITNTLDIPNFSTTTSVVVTARSIGDNLDQAATGSVDVYVRTFLLPQEIR